MATAMMHPPTHRPSMDRTPSFDAPRSRSTPPFTATYDRPTSPFARPHSRTNSNASNHSPYVQPFASGYFPPQPPMFPSHPAHQQAWTTAPIPASAFYPAPGTAPFQYPGQVFHQGFQQSQADFQSWANAYQHMVMASVSQGSMTPPPPPPINEYGERRRTNSGPAQHGSPASYFDQPQQLAQQQHQQQQYGHVQPPAPTQQSRQQAQQAGFHPYKRTPGHRPSRENVSSPISSSNSSVPRSQSQPTLSTPDSRSASVAGTRDTPLPVGQSSHARTASLDSPINPTSLPPPKRPAVADTGRQDSSDRSKDKEKERESPRVTSASPAISTPSPSPKPAPRAATPLHPGPIASATNAQPASRPSPLSQSSAPSPEPDKVKGFKNRFKKALDKPREPRSSTAPSITSIPTPTPVKSAPSKSFASPSEASTRSATPPVTPPQDLPPPARPFAVAHPQALSSDVSLADTERTATTPAPDQGKGKGKSLFRMRNMSTDNISLSSTVSSASMMIRKMGSIGKLARRNSLMGISKIFKDKPKDEDAALPEKEGKKEKKDKKKKSKGKGEPAPAQVSRATVDAQEVDEDRALAGLSPAAKLARQHTLRSRAEAAKKEEAQKAANGAPITGEPTWDNNTVTRPSHLPSISSVVTPSASGSSLSSSLGGPEVLHITPRTTSTMVHAVTVSEAEYDSEDDSSDGETVEDLTAQMGRNKLSDEADREFMHTWGQAVIDRNAVPKKGILKNSASFIEESTAVNRQRSNSTAETTSSGSVIGPLARPTADPDLIDGLHHPSPQAEHLEFTFDTPNLEHKLSFNPGHPGPYSNPQLNTSAPALSMLGNQMKPGQGIRSMTVPAGEKRRIIWAPECAVYQTYDAGTYDRRSEPATCNRLTPELAMAIKQELNAFKLEMPVHPSSRVYTHYFL